MGMLDSTLSREVKECTNMETDFLRKCLQVRIEAHLLAYIYGKLAQPTSVLPGLW